VLKRCNVEGVAICVLNSYVNPAHEQRLRELAREVLGDVPISISSDTSPLAKEYVRASTAVIDVFMDRGHRCPPVPALRPRLRCRSGSDRSAPLVHLVARRR
jgi:hypothetical protein